MCFQLRKNESASVYSEKFFEKLYAIEERAYAKYAKRNAKALKQGFDKNAVAEEFANNYKENLEFLKANLPSEILDEVKDLRVLALGTATNDVAMQITRFCGKKNRLCEAVEREYNNASEEADEKISGNVANRLLTLIGSEIVSIENNGENATLIFNPAESHETKSITLESATLVESDGSLGGASIVKYELLIAHDGGFEFSILALGKDSSLLTASYKTSTLSI
jgi:hypothetical protein